MACIAGHHAYEVEVDQDVEDGAAARFCRGTNAHAIAAPIANLEAKTYVNGQPIQRDESSLCRAQSIFRI
jgi:hypothetical protein